MSNILLDTSVIVDFLRSKEKNKTLFYNLKKKKHVFQISVITHTELYAGKSVWEKKGARAELDAIFKTLTIIPLTLPISINAGRLRAFNSLPTIDAIIAATALEDNIPLSTLNVRDFRKVKSLKLFTV